jgi:hypothetical protein
MNWTEVDSWGKSKGRRTVGMPHLSEEGHCGRLVREVRRELEFAVEEAAFV